MEVWQYDQQIDAARGKLSQLEQELVGLEGFSSEVNSACGAFEAQLGRKMASADKLRTAKNAHIAHMMADFLRNRLGCPGGSAHPEEAFVRIKNDVLRAIDDVEREIAQQSATIASLEVARSRKVAEDLARREAEAEVAAAAARAMT